MLEAVYLTKVRLGLKLCTSSGTTRKHVLVCLWSLLEHSPLQSRTVEHCVFLNYCEIIILVITSS